MGAVKLCRNKTAETPYYAESAGIHFYSVEELAFYLYENIYLADDGFVGEKLYEWLEKELGMKTLAERLRNGGSTGSNVYNHVMTILQASEYYSERELTELSQKIREISGMQTQERMKYKADEFLQNGNYWAAAAEYEKILSIRQSSRLSVGFYAAVWNNLAGSYARLFLFGKAALCFENAYRFEKLPEYRERACYARMLAEDGQEPEETLEAGLTEDFMRQAAGRLDAIEEKSRQKVRKTDISELLSDEKKKYGKISCFF